jgi:hypothetical protein
MSDEPQRSVAQFPIINRDEAVRFLQMLDDRDDFWCFQTFDDNKKRKDPNLARILGPVRK